MELNQPQIGLPGTDLFQSTAKGVNGQTTLAKARKKNSCSHCAGPDVKYTQGEMD